MSGWAIWSRSSAIGANYEQRGAVTDEYLLAMDHLRYDDHPEFHGRFADFGGVDAYPRPLQRPIPLVVGGRTPPAHRRAVSRAHGWYGFALTPDETAAQLVGLRRAADMVERPAALRELEISVTPRGRLTRETAAAFADAGVHRLVPMPPATQDGVAATIAAALEATAGI